MALQFQGPPEWLLQEYMNRKHPVAQAAEGAQGLLGSYMALQQQQQQQALAQQTAKTAQFTAIAPYTPEDQIGALAQQYGVNIPQQQSVQPPMAQPGVEPNFQSQTGEAMAVTPSGSPIINYMNSMLGGGQAMTPAAPPTSPGAPPMGPRPTSKFGLEKYKRNLEMSKIEQDLGVQEMYDQSGKHITTLPPGAKVVPTEKPAAPTPEDREMAKKQAKLLSEKPKARGSLRSTLREYDNMIKLSKEIANDPNLKLAAGVATPLGNVYGARSRSIRQKIETLKNKTLLNVMSNLKSLSATGATGFGALSEKEGETMKNSAVSLDPGQEPEQLKTNLLSYIADLEFSKQNLMNTWGEQYGEEWQDGAGPINATIGGAVSSQAQYDALPSGAEYLDAQGNKRRKR